eukprot:Amastigsp_a341895_43.p3 type:complete len:129 gc:universal Amastigsp_a341895_43:439-53(-)
MVRPPRVVERAPRRPDVCVPDAALKLTVQSLRLRLCPCVDHCANIDVERVGNLHKLVEKRRHALKLACDTVRARVVRSRQRDRQERSIGRQVAHPIFRRGACRRSKRQHHQSPEHVSEGLDRNRTVSP